LSVSINLAETIANGFGQYPQNWRLTSTHKADDIQPNSQFNSTALQCVNVCDHGINNTLSGRGYDLLAIAPFNLFGGTARKSKITEKRNII
jgi:hypothetical protein